MTSSASAPSDPAAHHRPHTLGGVVRNQVARGDADSLNKDVGQYDSGEREREYTGARRVRRQVAAEVRGVAGPRDRQAQRDRHLEDERPDQVGSVRSGGRDDLVTRSELEREHDERDEQDHRQHGLDPVDHLVAEESDRTLHTEHDEHSAPEGNAEQHGERFAAEQADQRIPRD